MSFVLCLFFLSGVIGLIDEIVWIRMLLLIFGSTTQSLVVVLSTFMAGLALGSFFLGRLCDRQKNLLRFYALLELGVGISALATLILIPAARDIYKLFYQQYPNPQAVGLVKIIFSSLTLLPATFFMGGTLPTLIRFFTKEKQELGKKTGLLYAVNTFGAALGTIVTGFVLIEIFGLSMTLILACLGNLFIGVLLLLLTKGSKERIKEGSKEEKHTPGQYLYDKKKLISAVLVFGFSGLISMAYEVAWTRLLTPSVGTYIYAFSIILTLFLTGIALGSYLAKIILTKVKTLFALFGLVEAGIGVLAIATVVVTSQFMNLGVVYKVVLVTLPATVLMGITFPICTALFSDKEKIGRVVGIIYAANTIGSIAGPIAAGFVLMPLFGTVKTILFLAGFNLFLAAVLFFQEKEEIFPKRTAVITSLVLMIAVFLLAGFKSELFLEKSLAQNLQKFKAQNYDYLYLEDETAAVLGYYHRSLKDGALLVDGVSMTGLSDETKFMAHIPLFMHPDPKKALVIAFGMGTTFRSALTHDIEVTGVELIPSVPKTFPIFHQDAKEILENPKAKITINDGRNFVFLAKEEYDLITVDPPPPINSAYTTVLYSKEFYEAAENILTEKGIFLQWLFLYGARRDDIAMLVKSFTEVFPHVSVWQGPGGWGIYLLGSKAEMTADKNVFAAKYKKEKIFKDINEWQANPYSLEQIMGLYKGNQEILARLIAGVVPVTDDRPRTEYFLLRQKFVQATRIQYIDDLWK